MDSIKHSLYQINFNKLKEFNLGQLENFKELKKIQLDKSFLLKVAFGSLIGLSIIYLGKIWWAYRFFTRRGIKTPKSKFIFGDLFQLTSGKKPSDVIHEWSKEFGKTYGYFEGHNPVLVTADLEIMQEVFIKQYNNFSARKKIPLTDSNGKSLIRATKSNWKRMRLIINPTFSSAKIREMGPLIVKCVDRLIEQTEKDSTSEIKFADYLKRFTMDTIWNCAFGLDIDLQNDRDNEYLKNSEALFINAQNLTFPMIFALLFFEFNPILTQVWGVLTKVSSAIFKNKILPEVWLYKKIDYLLERRKEENITKKDFMQLLLDAQSADFSQIATDGMHLSDLDNVRMDKKLTPEELRSNLVMFMLAGYETTSTALSYSTYVLATNQEEQQKLRDEIDSYFSEESNLKPDTENVKNLNYLDMFCKEVLRIYPIAKFMRTCTKKTTVKGIDIPVGLEVRANNFAVHFDPELWGPVDPYVFYPARHEVKRNPLAFLAFGLGPRNCIGMKFALIEMKLALVNILKNFEISASPNTPAKLDIAEGIVRSPLGGIPVNIKKRNLNNSNFDSLL